MILPDPALLRERLARADAEVRDARLAWSRHNLQIVDDADLEKAKSRIESAKQSLFRINKTLLRQRQVQLVLDSVRKGMAFVFCLERLEWFPASLLIGTVPVIVIAPFFGLLKLSLGWLLVSIVVVYVISLLIVARFLSSLDNSEFSGKTDLLAGWVAQRKAERIHLTAECDEAQRELERLKIVRGIQDRYEAAREDVAKYEATLANRRYQLAQMDWRSLRGVPFEEFLAEVFRELGYSVQMTKTSGDQGADLLLTGKGLRIAVQAKGYADAVGNGAIQEVYAGMTFYGCTRCAAVTNSSFTGPAQELAKRVGCLLVDGARIGELIEGRIL